MGLSVFVAIAPEDKPHLDAFAARARCEKRPFHFIEMPTRDEADERWRSKCRIQIRAAGGFVGLISKYSAEDPWQLWSIQCAVTEKRPILLMQVSQHEAGLPAAIAGKRIDSWSWTNARTFLDSLWHESSRSR